MDKSIGLLRTPLFSKEKFNSISDNNLKEIFSNSIFLEALYVANPVFHKTLLQWLSGKNKENEEKIKQTAYKYFSRSCYRCTPFGLFANTIDPKIKTDISNFSEYYKTPSNASIKIDFDATILYQIKEKVKQDINRSHLIYCVNKSFHKSNGDFHYFDFVVSKHIRIDYKLTNVEYSEALNYISSIFSNFISISKACDLFCTKYPDYSKEDVLSFIEELIESKILLSNLDTIFFKKDGLKNLYKIMYEIDNNNKWTVILSQILDLFESKLNIKKILENAYNMLISVGISIEDKGSIFQIEHYKTPPKTEIIIKKNLLDEIYEVRELLKTLQQPLAEMDEFNKEFKLKYGESLVPLLEVMNPLIGIGYVQKNEDFDVLNELKGFSQSKKNSIPQNVIITPFEQVLMKILTTNHSNNNIDLTNIKVSKKTTNKNNPVSSLLFAKVIEKGTKLYMREFMEISATKFLNRFAANHKNLAKELVKIAKKENEYYSDQNVLYAEFVHIPEIRMANLLKLTHNRQYEINTIYHSTETKQIYLDDLYLRLINDRIVLISKKNNKEVITTFSNSINPRVFPFNINNFLFDLQGQDNNFDLFFNWGNIAKLFNFLPRVTYKNIILSPSLWIVNLNEVANIQSVNALLEKRSIPNQIQIGSSITTDELLYLNLNIEIGKEIFYSELKKRKILYLFEVLDETFIVDENSNNYAHELLLPLIHPLSPRTRKEKIISKDEKLARYKYKLGEEWLYYKLYCTNRVAEGFIKEKLYIIFRDKHVKDIIDQWFFIRYYDNSFHIRLRIKVKDNKYLGTLFDLINKQISLIKENIVFSKTLLDTYEPELERYGIKSIRYCEKIFHYDSLIVCETIQQFQNDKFMIAVLGIENYFMLFKMSAKDKEIILTWLSKSFLKEFLIDKKGIKDLNMKYRTVSKKLDQMFTNDSKYRLLENNITKYNNSMQTAVNNIVKLDYTKTEVFDIIASLLHMFLNRLFTSKPRFNEMFIYYTLAKHQTRINSISNKLKN